MDQDKVNPFVGNTETPAGGTPISATPTASVDSAVSAPDPVNPYASAVPPTEANSATPVNPYAPAGAPYAPGSNTPAPSYADPISPAVPNTSAPDSAYTSFSPAPSQDFIPMDTPERPKLFTKKFVIFAVIGLVLIAGAVVAGLVLQGSRNGSGSGSSKSTSATTNSDKSKEIKATIKDTSSASEALTYLSNLMITGAETDTTPDFGAEQWYIATIATLGSNDAIILKREDAIKISKYYDMVEKLSENDKREDLAILRSKIKEDLSAYQDYLSIDYYEKTLTDKYLTENADAATAYANGLFGSTVSNNISNLDILKRYYLSFLLGKVSLLNTYAENRCISNNEINQECANQFVTTYTSLKAQKFAVKEYITPIFESIKTGLMQLYNLLGENSL